MNPQRILAINVSRIGDTLLATPALRAIASAYPDATLDCLAHPKRAEVLEHLPFLSHVGPITKKSAPFRGHLQALLRKPYDLAFVWGYDRPLVAYALRVARRVVAYRQQDERLNRRLFRVVDPPSFQGDHAVRLSMTLPNALGIEARGLRLAYAVADDERHWAEEELAKAVSGAAPLVGLQVASFPTKGYRDWPIENFMQLCDLIAGAHPNAHFLIFGGSLERERTAALKGHLGERATLYAGRLSLRQTAALMSHLDLYVGVDTGPTHIMSSFDIPLVGLYHGFSRSELIAPLDHPCLYAIDHPLAGPECPTESSMADIGVEQVWETVREALSGHRCPSPGSTRG